MGPKTISNDLRSILQDSMLEILGQKDLNEVLQHADLQHLTRADTLRDASDSTHSAQVSWLLEALDSRYGLSSGLGLGFRIGRVLFNRILRVKGSSLGLDRNSFRLLPHTAKIRTGLNTISEWMQNQSDQIIQLDFESDGILWRIHPCLECKKRKSDQPICFMTAGFLNEAMSWFSAGKFYNVQESECEACGHTQCSFEIRLNPLP